MSDPRFLSERKEMIYKMHKYMNMSFEDIYKMPVFEIMEYTRIHNKVAKQEEEEANR